MIKTTIVRDSHGCLHIWKGFHTPKYHPLTPTVNGSEADMFVQSCTAIDGIRKYITAEETEQLESGYSIHCTTLPAEYLIK